MRRPQFLLLPVFLISLAAPAQFESPLLSKVQLNLVNPGGKSLAMGGAFVSLADDSTAAIANPAGLTQLGAWQFGFSGKLFVQSPVLKSPTYYSGDFKAYELLAEDERLFEPGGQSTSAEFISVVGPLTKNISVAIYRSVNLRYLIDSRRNGFESYDAFTINENGENVVSVTERGEIDIENESYGVSMAARLGKLSLGAGLHLNRLHYELNGPGPSGEHVFGVNEENQFVSPPTIRTAAWSTTHVAAEVTSTNQLGGSIGALFQIDEAHRLALGAVYRWGTSFDVGYSIRSYVRTATQPAADFSCGRDDPRIPGSGASACGEFRVPDDFSIGISGRPHDRLLLSLDVQTIRYSQLNDGYVPLFLYCATRSVSPCPAQDRGISNGEASDATLLRAGVEYALTYSRESEIVVRAGYYREPAHGTRLTLYHDADYDRRPDEGASLEITAPPYSDAYRRTFDGGTTEHHFSFGAGARIGRSFSFDLAADLAKSNQSVVLSAFYRFR
jgi:hypothetical protein